MNPRASSGLKKRGKHRGTEFTSSSQPIKPNLRVRRLRPDLSGLRRPKAEAFFDLRSFSDGGSEGGLKQCRVSPKGKDQVIATSSDKLQFNRIGGKIVTLFLQIFFTLLYKKPGNLVQV